jgi:mannose-6-phosphate isomerase-like protein (cupin superfamily)
MTETTTGCGLRPYVLPPAQAETVKFLDTMMTIYAGTESTGGTCTVIDCTAPAGFSPPLHVHHHANEAFLLLEGEGVTVACDGEQFHAAPGSFIWLPTRLTHSFRVEGTTPARMLTLLWPSGFDDYVRDTVQIIGESGSDIEPTDVLEVLQQLGHKHGIDIVGPPLSPDDQ